VHFVSCMHVRTSGISSAFLVRVKQNFICPALWHGVISIYLHIQDPIVDLGARGAKLLSPVCARSLQHHALLCLGRKCWDLPPLYAQKSMEKSLYHLEHETDSEYVSKNLWSKPAAAADILANRCTRLCMHFLPFTTIPHHAGGGNVEGP
jgi:hypothetical protein